MNVILAGNSITAQIIFAYLQDDPRFNVVGFTVDDEFVSCESFEGVPVVPISKVAKEFDPIRTGFIASVGYRNLNRNREKLFESLMSLGFAAVTYVHPDARIYTRCNIGEGSVILGNAVVEPFAKIGRNCLVWCNSTLAHHSTIGDHCWIASGAVVSGNATVCRNAFIGVNATITNNVVIGEYCLIGGGSLISKCTKSSSVHLSRNAEELRFTAEDYDKHFGI